MEKHEDKTKVSIHHKYYLTAMRLKNGRDHLELVRIHKDDQGITANLTSSPDLATQFTRDEANLLQAYLELAMGWPVKITPFRDLRDWRDQHYWGLR